MSPRAIRFSNRQIDLSYRETVVRDMRAADPRFHPDAHWERAEESLLEFFAGGDDFLTNHQFEDRHRLGTDPRDWRDFDHLGLHEAYDDCRQLPWTRAIDHVNKTWRTAAALRLAWTEPGARVHVLEVGGGYGRTALFFLNHFGPRITYVNVDAVPTALLVSEQFLRANCRAELRIGGCRDVLEAGGRLDPSAYNYLSVPAWHMSALPPALFDVAMNIWSMQEMDVHHQDLYFDLFRRACRDDALLFFLNCNKRKFARGYRFPSDWLLLYEGVEPTYGNPERMLLVNPSVGRRRGLSPDGPMERLRRCLFPSPVPLARSMERLVALGQASRT